MSLSLLLHNHISQCIMHNISWTFVRENNEPPEKNSVKTVFFSAKKYPRNTAKKLLKLFHARFILKAKFHDANQSRIFTGWHTNNVSKWLMNMKKNEARGVVHIAILGFCHDIFCTNQFWHGASRQFVYYIYCKIKSRQKTGYVFLEIWRI